MFKQLRSTARFVRVRPYSSIPPVPPIVKTIPVKQQSKVRKYFKYTLASLSIATLSSIAYVSYKIYQETNPPDQLPQAEVFANGQKRKTIVILGSGWGSISLLKDLDTTLYNVIVVSPRNYFLFTPLLPSCPTGTVELRSIIEPVRSIARRSAGEVIFLEAEATDIDPTTNTLTIKQSTVVHSGVTGKSSDSSKSTVGTEITNTLQYDYLVVGVGAQPSTFGIPGVAEHSLFLKELSDSAKIRRQIMDNIEAASMLPSGTAERKRLLSMVIVGGGPTGVELAGELQDYIDQDLKKWMPSIASEIKVTLVEALPNVLSMFNKKLIGYTQDVFKSTNIDLKTSAMVKNVDDKNVYAQVKIGDKTEMVEIPYGVLVWATGNAPRDITKNLCSKIPEQASSRRGLVIGDNLLVNGSTNIFGLGDCTFGKNAPTAQVAHQQGKYLAGLFQQLHQIDSLSFNSTDATSKQLEKAKILPNFKYNHQGSLAYIGSEKAVADLVWGDWNNESGGGFTFLIWRSAYIYMCLSVKNQVLVCMDWVKVGVFGRDCSKE